MSEGRRIAIRSARAMGLTIRSKPLHGSLNGSMKMPQGMQLHTLQASVINAPPILPIATGALTVVKCGPDLGYMKQHKQMSMCQLRVLKVDVQWRAQLLTSWRRDLQYSCLLSVVSIMLAHALPGQARKEARSFRSCSECRWSGQSKR
jgi:hypothetical protein